MLFTDTSVIWVDCIPHLRRSWIANRIAVWRWYADFSSASKSFYEEEHYLSSSNWKVNLSDQKVEPNVNKTDFPQALPTLRD